MDSRLKEIVFSSKNTVFFGGAGVSTSSGIPDFRSADGIYSKNYGTTCPPEQILSHSFFEKNTEEFYMFYKNNMIFKNAKPNDCHKALAYLESIGIVKAVVTQNIDGLHQAAGSKVVYELHGSVLRNYCTKCGEFYDENYVLSSAGVPKCEKCGDVIKPDVVLYGEMLDDTTVRNAVKAISQADTLIIGGTSLTVYPAASFIEFFSGKNLILINKTPTSADSSATLVIRENIAEAMKID